MNTKYLLPVLMIVATSSCSNNQQAPKPKAYPRIEFPVYESYFIEVKECHYGFNIPVYAKLKPDPYPNPDECWYNVHFLPFNATLHLSYKPLKNRKELFKMLDDANTMVFKHVMKADEIKESFIKLPDKYGIFYELDGSTATHNQFYITDSVHHFLRGSLYFNVRTNNDSIAPVVDFLKKDVLRIIASLKWQ